jgi:hypothetical protein
MKGLCQRCFSSNMELILCRGIPKCLECYNKDKCEEDI